MEYPLLAELRFGCLNTVIHDKYIRKKMHELPHALAAFLSVGLRCVRGDIRKISVRLEGKHLCRLLVVLSAVVLIPLRALVLRSPIVRDRLVRSMDQHAVMSDGLGIIVSEIMIRLISTAS